MRAYIVGSSALYCWRRDLRANHAIGDFCKGTFSDCIADADSLDALRLSAFDFGPEPLHLMVPSVEMRIRRKRYYSSVWSGRLPAEAFCNHSARACIASPEFCLFQAALCLSRAQLIELCMELCGRYALVLDADRGFVSRDYALATRESVTRLTDAMRGTNCSSQLAHALEHVVEGSRSPMETREYLLMCLPKNMGGFGLPRPLMNGRVKLTKAEQKKAMRQHFECDLLWPEQRVVIEYDGHDDHASRIDRARDAMKRDVLVAKGYTVFVVTGAQIMDELLFEGVVRDVARAIGYRLRAFPRDWAVKHSLLRSELFETLSSCGAERFF